ncbi:MAG: tetratricopeptide repeat protein [bacterium]|nr:tetratricopeptide repeat protein [bacterium]
MNKNEELYPIPAYISEESDLATSLVNEGKLREAREIIQKLLLKEPEHPRLLNSLGATYLNEGDFDKAEKVFLRAKERGPGFSIPYGNLCLLCSTTGRLDEAARYAELTIGFRPDYAGTWYALGVYYTQINKFKTALDYFLAAHSLDSEYLPTVYNIACAYCKLNQPEKSLEYFEVSMADIRLFKIAEDDSDIDAIRGLAAFKKIMEKASKKHRGEE